MPKQEVILLDEGRPVTKYVAVGLRNAGCSVHMVTAAGPGERLDAKYLGKGITCEGAPLVHFESYISAVGAIVAAHPSAIVLPLTEEILYRIWDTVPAWADRQFPGTQPWQRTVLRDKARLSEYFGSCGVRIPKQQSISPSDDLSAAVQAFGLPVVVKGTTGAGGNRVRIARTYQDALDSVTGIAKGGGCFLQEYVAGPTFIVAGLFYDGEPIRIHAAEKIELAHATGPSIRLRSDDDRDVMSLALAVFRALRWTGLASLDMMRRPDGEYTFIEFNPRPWGSTATSARAGVDLFHPLVSLLSGHTPEPDLSFVPNDRTTLFPQAATVRLQKGGIRSLACLVREPHLWLDAPWNEPGLVAHLARELWWLWRDTTLVRPRSAPPQCGLNRTDQGAGSSFESEPPRVPKS